MSDDGEEMHDDTGVDLDPRLASLIVDAIEDGDEALFAHYLSALHPADAADVIEQLSVDQLTTALALSPHAFIGDLMAEVSDDARAIIVENLPDAALAAAAAELDSDDAALVLDDLSDERRQDVLNALPDRDRRAIEESLAFEDETAGRLMQREFVAAPEHWSVGRAIDHLRGSDPNNLPEVFFEIFLVDPAFRPIGAIALSTLLMSRRDTPLRDIAREPETLIKPEMDQEDVAFAFEKYRLVQAAVVDEAGRLTGMITIDDMVDVIQEENTEDLLALAGVSDARVSDSVLATVRSRAPWLLLNLATAIAASFVIALFESVIAAAVALAILMPIVASMGGNAGTQTLTVAVRALAQRDLTIINARRIIWREVSAGAVNGVLFALVMALVALIWFGDAKLAGVMAAAMVINLVSAGLSGILIPLALQRAGSDPAVSSAVFLTTVTDIVGFFAFLGLASLILI